MADVWAAIIKDWATGNAIAESHLDEEIRDRMTVLALAVDGDGSTSTIKHRHKTGTLAARPTPGEAGRLYYATDLGLWLFDDGTEWWPTGHNSKLCAYWGDDFIAGYDLNWKTLQSGGNTISELNRNGGWVRLELTASGQRVLLSKGQTVYDPAKKSLLIMRYKVEVEHADGNMRGGWGTPWTTTDLNPTDGIFIRKLGTGNFFGVCRASSTETTQDLGVDGTAETLYIVERDAGGVSFYVNTYNAAGKQGSTITTNIPTALVLLGHKLSGAGTPDFDIDATDAWMARSA